MMMHEIAGFTVVGAFLLGLAHTLEPCEDKVVVSFLTLWGSEKWKQGLSLVLLYGLAMTLVNTLLVVVFCMLGAEYIEGLEIYLAVIAGIIMIIFGLVMPMGKHFPHLCHLTHHDWKKKKSATFLPGKEKAYTVLLLGVIRGLPYCPIELAVVLWAISIGSILEGATIMFVFGLGTTIGLIPMGFIMGGIAQKAKKTRYNKYLPVICGFAFITFGIALIIMHLLGIGHGH